MDRKCPEEIRDPKSELAGLIHPEVGLFQVGISMQVVRNDWVDEEIQHARNKTHPLQKYNHHVGVPPPLIFEIRRSSYAKCSKPLF